jgi:hypothetical protein
MVALDSADGIPLVATRRESICVDSRARRRLDAGLRFVQHESNPRHHTSRPIQRLCRMTAAEDHAQNGHSGQTAAFTPPGANLRRVYPVRDFAAVQRALENQTVAPVLDGTVGPHFKWHLASDFAATTRLAPLASAVLANMPMLAPQSRTTSPASECGERLDVG